MTYLPGVDGEEESGLREYVGRTFDPKKYVNSPEPQQRSSSAAAALAFLQQKDDRRKPGFNGAGGGGIKSLMSNVYANNPNFDYEVFHGKNVAGHTGHLHLAAPSGLVKLGKKLEKKGFSVGEHPAFGGVAPVHTDNSHHYDDDALDIGFNNFDTKWAQKHGITNEGQALRWLKRRLRSVFGDAAEYKL